MKNRISEIAYFWMYAEATKIALYLCRKVEENGDFRTASDLRADIMSEGENGGAGMQVLYAAFISLCDSYKSAPIESEGVGFTEWINVEYIRKKPSKRIIPISGKPAKFSDEKVTARRLAYRKAWKAVRETAGNRYCTDKYCYIEDIPKTETEGTEEALYRRLPAYHTAEGDRLTYEQIENLMIEMNLTKAQKQVIDYRLAGYSIKAIADILGLHKKSVQDRVSGTAKKALAVLRSPDYTSFAILEALPTEAEKEKPVQLDDHCKAFSEYVRKQRETAEKARTASVDLPTSAEDAEAFRQYCKAEAEKKKRRT